MLEDNKIVKSIQVKAGGKSGTYWTVTWQDGKTDNIFNADWLPLLEQSQAENRLLHFGKEQVGKYYNIKLLELAELPAPKKIESIPKSPVVTGGIKPVITSEETKIRSMAVAYAKDLVVADKIKLEQLRVYADKFIDYILDKEPKPSRSIVTEAKKMGAVEE